MQTQHRHCHSNNPLFTENRRGRPDSYWLQDGEDVFSFLDMKEGECFADLGCGLGNYSIHAARLVGPSGKVYALDRNAETLSSLQQRMIEEDVRNVRTVTTDLTEGLPVPDCSTDVCMLATVLHSLPEAGAAQSLFCEIKRILNPGGRLAIIELKKEEMGFGLPVSIRRSPAEIEPLICPLGFEITDVMEYKYSYLLCARL